MAKALQFQNSWLNVVWCVSKLINMQMVQSTQNICSDIIAVIEGAEHRNVKKPEFNITVRCTSI